MNRHAKLRALGIAATVMTAAVLASLAPSDVGHAATDSGRYLSPLCLAVAPDGTRLLVAEHTGERLDIVDLKAHEVTTSVELPGLPAGVVVSPDGSRAYVACADIGQVAVVDLARGRVADRVEAGSWPWGLTLSSDGGTLYVCNRFSNDVSVVDTKELKETHRWAAVREPSFSALSEATGTLAVANILPLGSDHDFTLACEISLINTGTGEATTVRLPSGCNQAYGIACSPDGQWVYVVHLLGRFLVPTTQIQRGWINTNALSVINVAERKLLATVLIDDLDLGAANPYGLVMSPDGSELYIALRGTHQMMTIDVPGLHRIIGETPEDKRPDLANDLTFLYRNGVKKRMVAGGRSPRGIAVSPDGGSVYLANYFSDTVTELKPKTQKPGETIALGPEPKPDQARQGEMLFYDADLCFQKWQSCASCHPDTRADGLMWDLLNDGLGNPKNTKSLILSNETPPMMAQAVREAMPVAVEAGIRYILFRQPEQADIDAIVSYLSGLEPVKSPLLSADGKVKEQIKRGKKLFEDPDIGCAKCHPAPLYTDLQSYDVGTMSQFDRVEEFDTPTLREMFRTGPYLHDGTAVTMKDVLTTRNAENKHGNTAGLSPEQIDDLVAYVMSL